MQKSIKRLENANEYTKKALQLLKKGDFDSLSTFYGLSSVPKEGHLLSNLLGKDDEVKEKYAQLFTEKVKETSFVFTSDFSLVYEEEVIGALDPLKKEITVFVTPKEKEREFKKKSEILNKKEKELNERLIQLKEFTEKKEKKMKKGKKKVLFEKFKESLYALPGKIEKINEEQELLKKEKESFVKTKELLLLFEKKVNECGYEVK